MQGGLGVKGLCLIEGDFFLSRGLLAAAAATPARCGNPDPVRAKPSARRRNPAKL